MVDINLSTHNNALVAHPVLLYIIKNVVLARHAASSQGLRIMNGAFIGSTTADGAHVAHLDISPV